MAFEYYAKGETDILVQWAQLQINEYLHYSFKLVLVSLSPRVHTGMDMHTSRIVSSQ